MKKLIKVIVFTFFAFIFVPGQQVQRVKIMTYNILDYPSHYTTQNPNFKIVLQATQPDVLVVEEMQNQNGVNIFLNNVLDSTYKAGTFIQGYDTNNALFYKDSLFTFVSNTPIHTDLRDISEFKIFNKLTSDTLIIFAAHLKASTGFEQQRLSEVIKLRDVTDALPPNTDYIAAGDFNFYYSSEPGYQKFLDTTTSGYFIDPLNAPGYWHNTASFSYLHTQSTCNLSSGCPNGGSNGGLDDRFDFILVSPSLMSPGGIDYIDNTYTAFGNDGQHFNKSINDPPFTIITQSMANALFNSSDHLPVFAEFDFGARIEGLNQNLSTNINTYTLYQNYPNPFNPSTKINFELPKSENVRIIVYNMLGEEIALVYKGKANRGLNSVTFNARVSGLNLSSGIYIYQLHTEESILSRKMILLK